MLALDLNCVQILTVTEETAGTAMLPHSANNPLVPPHSLFFWTAATLAVY